MSEVIFAIQDELLKPLMTAIEEQYFEHLKAEKLSKGALSSNSQHLRNRAKKEVEEFKNDLIGREELQYVEKGFDTVLHELPKLPNHASILKNLQEAGRSFIHNQEEITESQTINFYDTLQEMFGISKETYDGFYRIGSDYFNNKKDEEALGVFSLLTNLNPFVFEPWLGQGICWQKKKNHREALRSFAMASLVNSKHPAPYLHTVDIYLSEKNTKLAQEMILFCEKKCSKDLLKDYARHIKYLRKQIKEQAK